MRLKRFDKVFSGKQSRQLWDLINRVKGQRTKEALYDMGCHCQRLESMVHQLEERVAQLELEIKE